VSEICVEDFSGLIVPVGSDLSADGIWNQPTLSRHYGSIPADRCEVYSLLGREKLGVIVD
jgi:hypothetical protein